jgi:hypothetical protein
MCFREHEEMVCRRVNSTFAWCSFFLVVVYRVRNVNIVVLSLDQLSFHATRIIVSSSEWRVVVMS